MLSNAHFLAKFRFDTAENEPAKNLRNFAKKIANFATLQAPIPTCAGDRAAGVLTAAAAVHCSTSSA